MGVGITQFGHQRALCYLFARHARGTPQRQPTDPRIVGQRVKKYIKNYT